LFALTSICATTFRSACVAASNRKSRNTILLPSPSGSTRASGNRANRRKAIPTSLRRAASSAGDASALYKTRADSGSNTAPGANETSTSSIESSVSTTPDQASGEDDCGNAPAALAASP
jgi:hypothetical protein